MPPERSATIVDRRALTPAVWRLRLRPDEPIPFRAGQYLLLRVGGHWEGYFSIASSEADPANLEILVGAGSAPALLAARLEERVGLVGPNGDLGIDPDAPGHLFLATGAGIAPIWSMLDALERSATTVPAILLYGHRTPEEVPYREELHRLARESSWFRFVEVHSRVVAGASSGRLTARLPDILPETTGWTVYVCGRDAMVSEVRSQLRAAGVDPRKIRADLPDDPARAAPATDRPA